MRLGLKAMVAAISATALVAGASSAAFAKPPKGPGKVIVVKKGGGHHHGGKGLAIGLGVATAAALAAGAAYASDVTPGQCRRWDRRCDDGEGWACRKYAKYCD